MKYRLALFFKLKAVLNENIDGLAQLVKTETGKLRSDFDAEIFDIIDAIDYYSGKIRQVKTDTSLKLNPQAFSNSFWDSF